MSRYLFSPPLVGGRLVRRYKRFLADITLDDGSEIVAHCPSPGAMTGMATPGARVWVSRRDDPRRKLGWTWEITTGDSGALVCVNSTIANDLVAAGAADGAIASLAGYASRRREARVDGGSRLDLLLEGRPGDPRPCWVEVKTVTLDLGGGRAAFPDAVTKRGLRHLRVLAQRASAGERAVIFYLAARDDATCVVPADAVDPAYGRGLREALRDGVEAIAWRADVRPDAITLAQRLPVLGTPDASDT